ncbi:hypothetical protein VIGAN_01502600 [Vigna angularis var. angularis]|uniref:Uncharacterized protein n=1 Tax=Vigna angularis var. angularis TaxID=157739 RepID=A0A0S3R8G1_PHAAN|nr:hypothetical protein VIGAN_01502600 [Vigna angularis var. angularis]
MALLHCLHHSLPTLMHCHHLASTLVIFSTTLLTNKDTSKIHLFLFKCPFLTTLQTGFLFQIFIRSTVQIQNFSPSKS